MDLVESSWNSFLKVGKLILLLEAIFSKTVKLIFLYFSMKLQKDGLPKDGFDLIALKVIFQGPNGQKRVKSGYFSTCWQCYQETVW